MDPATCDAGHQPPVRSEPAVAAPHAAPHTRHGDGRTTTDVGPARFWSPHGTWELDTAIEQITGAPYELGTVMDTVARTPGWWAGCITYDGRATFTRYTNQRPTSDSGTDRDRTEAGRHAPSVTTSLDRDGYVNAVRAAQEAIGRGDCYQVNLCTRFELTGLPAGSLHHAWHRLTGALRPAFAALVPGPGGGLVACLSPERFLEVEGNQIRTSPIKGTRPRGRTPQEDARAVRALRDSPKEQAENIMIVDLLRNDLGRVARIGSVRAGPLLQVETYPHLHHLVSTVTAELAAGRGLGDLVTATFPCGSVTGAPKMAAMDVIARLETATRGVSMGAVGWVRSTGRPEGLRVRLGVAIRTVEMHRNRAWFCAGSGIVAGSDPKAEHDELLLKADALLRALGASPAP